MGPAEARAGHARGRPGGWMGYAVATLVLAGVAVAATGGDPEIAGGIVVAWAIQVAAVRPLAAALEARRDATRAWLGGLAARVGGLIATGTVAVVGTTSSRLPVAYGIAIVVLLLTEAGWLYRRLTRPGRVAEEPAGTEHRREGTRTTG